MPGGCSDTPGKDPRNHDINLKISFFISTYYETLLSYTNEGTFEGIFNNRYNNQVVLPLGIIIYGLLKSGSVSRSRSFLPA